MISGSSAVGGGSAPGLQLPTVLLSIARDGQSAAATEALVAHARSARDRAHRTRSRRPRSSNRPRPIRTKCSRGPALPIQMNGGRPAQRLRTGDRGAVPREPHHRARGRSTRTRSGRSRSSCSPSAYGMRMPIRHIGDPRSACAWWARRHRRDRPVPEASGQRALAAVHGEDPARDRRGGRLRHCRRRCSIAATGLAWPASSPSS